VSALTRVNGLAEISVAGAILSPRGRERATNLFALTPFVPLSRHAGEGGLWSAEAELPPDAEAALQHSKYVRVRLTPLPRSGRGLGVRAKKARLFPTQRTQAVYPYQPEATGITAGTRAAPSNTLP